MSIIRVGLAETKNFSEGWESIFGGKKKAAEPAKKSKAKAKPKAVKEEATKKKSKKTKKKA